MPGERRSSQNLVTSEVFFRIKLSSFFDALMRLTYFLGIELNNFQGDLSGVSAKTATLLVIYTLQAKMLNEPTG